MGLTDNVGRLGSPGCTSGDSTEQRRVVTGRNDTDAERTRHVEKDDAVDCRVEGFGHDAARVLDFARDHLYDQHANLGYLADVARRTLLL